MVSHTCRFVVAGPQFQKPRAVLWNSWSHVVIDRGFLSMRFGLAWGCFDAGCAAFFPEGRCEQVVCRIIPFQFAFQLCSYFGDFVKTGVLGVPAGHKACMAAHGP